MFVDALARCSLVDPLGDPLVQSYIKEASEGQTYGARLIPFKERRENLLGSVREGFYYFMLLM